MRAQNTEEVNTNEVGDETHSLGSHEKEDVRNSASSWSVPISSKK